MTVPLTENDSSYYGERELRESTDSSIVGSIDIPSRDGARSLPFTISLLFSRFFLISFLIFLSNLMISFSCVCDVCVYVSFFSSSFLDASSSPGMDFLQKTKKRPNASL